MVDSPSQLAGLFGDPEEKVNCRDQALSRTNDAIQGSERVGEGLKTESAHRRAPVGRLLSRG